MPLARATRESLRTVFSGDVFRPIWADPRGLGVWSRFLATIAFCSTLRIGPYLFYTEKCITQFKTTEKKMIGHRTRLRENYDLQLWRGGEVQP